MDQFQLCDAKFQMKQNVRIFEHFLFIFAQFLIILQPKKITIYEESIK